jgi:hypothetical protein
MSQVIIAGDTSGTITLQAPAVSGSTVLTLPAATGTVMVSGNMPAFSAYAGSSQSVTNNTFTKVQINTEIFDTANCFDSTTNYRFTPNVAGYYQVNAVIRATGTMTAILIAVYKNGSVYARGTEFNSTVGTPQIVFSNIIYMNGSTDYIELYGFISGTGVSFNVNSSDSTSQFSAVLVRGA